MSAAYLSNVETGKTVPSPRLVEVTAAVLKVDPLKIAGREVGPAEPLLPKASVVRRLKQELIRTAYSDLIEKGKPWDKVGWMEVQQVGQLIPGKLSAVAIQDLVRLGVVEERSRRIRVRLEAAGDEELAKALTAFREYRSEYERDAQIASNLDHVLEASSRILRRADVASRRIGGLYLMFQETLTRIQPIWMIQARIPLSVFEKHRSRWQASVAAAIVGGPGEALPRARELLRDLKITRETGPSLVSPEAAPAEFASIVHETVSYYALGELPRQPAILDVATCGWLLWSSACAELGSPRTEEAVVRDWRPKVFSEANSVAGTKFSEVDEWYAATSHDPLGGETLDSPTDIAKLTAGGGPSDGDLAIYRATDVLCFPWDLI